MDENFLFQRYLAAKELDREVALEQLRQVSNARGEIIDLINTRRIKRKELAAVLGITVSGLRRKLRNNSLTFDDCLLVLDAFLKRSKEINKANN